MKEKKKLDLEKLKKRKRKILSTEEALKDIEPMVWSDEVLSREKKALVSIGTR